MKSLHEQSPSRVLPLATAPAWQLFLAAGVSRLLIVAYMLLCSTAGENYDRSDDYYGTALMSSTSTAGEAWKFAVSAEKAFKSLNHWDSVHYWSIAAHGFRFAPQRAFFPLYPLVVLRAARAAGTGLHLSNAGFSLFCYVFACAVNVLCFSGAAVLLRTLTLESSSKDRGPLFVSRVMILFLLGPAAVFSVATYTESLFTFLTMASGLLFARGQISAGSLVAAAAATTRPNGILLVCPVIFAAAKSTRKKEKSFALALLVCLVQCALIASPYVLVNYVSCLAHPEVVPEPSGLGFLRFYQTIQEQHWNVGPFRYYTPRKLPNFIIGLPLPCFVCLGILRRKVPLRHKIEDPWLVMFLVSTVLCCVALHVETINRLLMSNPAVYWYLAPVLENSSRAQARLRWLLVAFLCCWIVIGGGLFSKHLPWT
jgi:Gpi18-like mannosyltransferase